MYEINRQKKSFTLLENDFIDVHLCNLSPKSVVVYLSIERMSQKGIAFTKKEISDYSGIPIGGVKHCIKELREMGIIDEVV
jgi:hypothetical protein